LSDLSGPIMTTGDFEPYITVYPILSEETYAIAKTWPDESAPRAGCVLTHTLFVPMPVWQDTEHPDAFASLLEMPDRDNLKQNEASITFDPSRMNTRLTALRENHFEYFLSCYFGEGRKPIVWLGAHQAENAMWHVVRALWPRLRAR